MCDMSPVFIDFGLNPLLVRSRGRNAPIGAGDTCFHLAEDTQDGRMRVSLSIKQFVQITGDYVTEPAEIGHRRYSDSFLTRFKIVRCLVVLILVIFPVRAQPSFETGSRGPLKKVPMLRWCVESIPW